MNINAIAEQLRMRAKVLHDIPMDDLIVFFDVVGAEWQRDEALQKQMPYVRSLASFLRRERVVPMLNEALRGDYHILDRFIGGRHAQPRGLAVHWLAGNAVLLGFYSLVLALLTKNVSIVKPSSRAYADFETLLARLREARAGAFSGGAMLDFVAVVHADRTEKETHTALSRVADARIAWGGSEAIEVIAGLPKAAHCEDIVFGPKYSFGIVDRASMARAKEIATKIALDVCTFDQFACSSPHTIFVEESGEAAAEAFAVFLGEALDFVGKKFIPKETGSVKKRLDILTRRATSAMRGDIVSASADTEWTVITSREPGFAPACGSRVLTVKPVPDLRDIIQYIDRGKQTLGMAVTQETEAKLLDELTRHGVDRCVPFGAMTLFDIPWDGMFAPDRLVRWVSVRQYI